jgi:hypothetical protein
MVNPLPLLYIDLVLLLPELATVSLLWLLSMAVQPLASRINHPMGMSKLVSTVTTLLLAKVVGTVTGYCIAVRPLFSKATP